MRGQRRVAGPVATVGAAPSEYAPTRAVDRSIDTRASIAICGDVVGDFSEISSSSAAAGDDS